MFKHLLQSFLKPCVAAKNTKLKTIAYMLFPYYWPGPFSLRKGHNKRSSLVGPCLAKEEVKDVRIRELEPSICWVMIFPGQSIQLCIYEDILFASFQKLEILVIIQMYIGYWISLICDVSLSHVYSGIYIRVIQNCTIPCPSYNWTLNTAYIYNAGYWLWTFDQSQSSELWQLTIHWVDFLHYTTSPPSIRKVKSKSHHTPTPIYSKQLRINPNLQHEPNLV